MRKITVTVQEDDGGECFIEIPEEILTTLNFREDDVLEIKQLEDGSVTLQKKYLDEPIQLDMFEDNS